VGDNAVLVQSLCSLSTLRHVSSSLLSGAAAGEAGRDARGGNANLIESTFT